MSREQWLECWLCGQQAALGAFAACPACAADGRAGVLEVVYAAVRERDAAALAEPAGGASGIWRWRELLPVLGPAADLLSLGEGATPLIPARRSVAGVVGAAFYLKYEGTNPTHSFKDRFQAVAVSAAAALGFAGVVCASTGNHGVAAAAYAARAGLRCTVLLHEEAPPAQSAAIRLFGATAVSLPPAQRARLLCQLVDAGWYPSTTFWPLPVANPYGIEGYKTIAYELFGQLGPERAAATQMFVPVGGGDSIYGVYKGWAELVRLGALERMPRLYACQPDGAAPLVAAEQRQLAEVPLVDARRSLGLSIRESATGNHGLRAIRDSGGRALAVSDGAIVDAVERLAADGLAVDPASAASFAGALQLANDQLEPASVVVCLLTASGARWPRPVGSTPLGAQVATRSADQAYAALVALTESPA